MSVWIVILVVLFSDCKASSTQSIIPVCLYFLQSAFVNSQFKDWSVNSKVAGQVKSGGGMTFVAVEAAGHMVPMDQPQVVCSLSHYAELTFNITTSISMCLIYSVPNSDYSKPLVHTGFVMKFCRQRC